MKYSKSIDARLTGRHKKSFHYVGDVKDKVILDIGCSYGWFEKWALENNCKRIIGLDMNIDDIQENMKSLSNSNFLRGSALNLPFVDEIFDVVVMWEVLEHIPQNTENIAFREINRVLKSGGSLFLSTPNKSLFSCILDPAWWLTGHRHYSKKTLKAMTVNQNLELKNVDYGGGFAELIGMILLYIFKWVFKREMLFKSYFDKKRDLEFLGKKGFTNIFITVKKID